MKMQQWFDNSNRFEKLQIRKQTICAVLLLVNRRVDDVRVVLSIQERLDNNHLCIKLSLLPIPDKRINLITGSVNLSVV